MPSAQASAEETKILADDATRDLEKAMPALDAAVDALEKLDKKSIAEARPSLANLLNEL